MSLVALVIILVIVGLILWLINSYIPLNAVVKKTLNAVVFIALIIWLLNLFGLIEDIKFIIFNSLE